MHYSKTAFMNGTEPTIVTNIPAFIDVIGQRMDFSEYDIQKLSRLYNCSKCLRLPNLIFYNLFFFLKGETKSPFIAWFHNYTKETNGSKKNPVLFNF